MPRIQVRADDGWLALDELAVEEQLSSEHYRRCLADRLRWAVRDAERHAYATAEGDRPEAVAPQLLAA